MIHTSVVSRIFLLLLAGLLSCKPPEVIEPVPEPEDITWELHPEIRLDRRLQIQAKATFDRLWLLGNNYLLSLDPQHQLVSDELVAPRGNQLWYRSFLSESYFATELTSKHVFELRNNYVPEQKARIDLRALDPTIFEVNFYYNQPMAINSRGRLLVGGKRYSGNLGAGNGIPMFIFQTQQAADSIEVKLEQKFEINQGISNAAGSNYLTGVYAFGESFFFSNSENGFYQLQEGEEPELVLPLELVHMFRRNDTLFAMGYQVNFSFGMGFLPPGDTQWQFRSFGNLDNGFLRFDAIENRIITFRGSQIWEIVPDPSYTSLNIRELNNRGLDQVTIHDIEAFQGRVYLCTERGLFFLPINDFFTFKPEE